MARGRRRSGQQGPKLWIELSHTEPVKGIDGWSFDAIAEVGLGNAPARDKKVEFLRDVDVIGTEEVNESGRAVCAISEVNDGRHRISAYVVGTMARDHEVLVLGEKKDKPKTKVPKELLATFLGEWGRQVFLLSVKAEDGTLIPNFPIEVFDESQPTEAGKTLRTGQDGFVRYQMNFSAPSCYVEFRAGNSSELRWANRVLGPKPKTPKPAKGRNRTKSSKATGSSPNLPPARQEQLMGQDVSQQVLLPKGKFARLAEKAGINIIDILNIPDNEGGGD